MTRPAAPERRGSGKRRRGVPRAAVAVTALLCAASGATGQGLPEPPATTATLDAFTLGDEASQRAALIAQQEALLARTRARPTDHDATFAYVIVSKRLRDYEAAVGALERLLFYNPRLTRAKYELGAIYFQMGSYDLASRYLRDAIASPELEPSTRARAAVLLPEAEKQTSQSRWSGFFQLGLRYQSNATFIPTGSLVRLNGQDLLIDPSRRRRPDGAGFGLASIAHDYDFDNQRGDVLETRFTAFGSKQFRATEYDFGFVEASLGPRFGLPELMPGASVKPYIVGGASFLRTERTPYIASGGGGVSLRLPILEGWTVEPGFEVRTVDASERTGLGFSTLSTGHSISAYMRSNLRLADGLDLETRSLTLWADGRFPWQSFTRTGFDAALNIQFDPPSDLIGRKWKLSPFIGVARSDFDSPNPFIDPRIKRRDTEWRGGATIDAPLTETFGVSATVQYDWIQSNLPNYRQRGVTVLGGPTARF